MIDFPASPTTGQIFTTGGLTYKFDGTAWQSNTATALSPDAPLDGKLYGRKNATWVDTALTNYVLKTGDTMTGVLTIAPAVSGNAATLALSAASTAAVDYNAINAYAGGVIRWQILPGDNTTAKDFVIQRFDASGAYVGQPFRIANATGLVALAGDVTVGGNVSIAGNLLSCAGNQMGLRWDGGSFTYLGFQTPTANNWCFQWNRTNGALNWLGASANVLVGIDPSVNLTAPGINATGYNYATHIRLGAGSPTAGLANFNWYDDGSAPSYLWGSSDAVNMRVYPPSRLTVSRADTCRLADGSNAVNGISGWNYANRAYNPPYLWSTAGSGADQFLVQPGNLSVNYANSAGSAPANGGTSSNSNGLGGIGPGGWLQNSSSALISIRNNGAAQLLASISGSGDSWWPVNPPSDANLKKNIAPTRVDALAEVRQIEFVEFQYRDDIPWVVGPNDPPDHPATTSIDDGRLHDIGVTIQQLETVNPELVETGLGTWGSPKQDKLLYRALRSIQQLADQVDELKARIAVLEGRT